MRIHSKTQAAKDLGKERVRIPQPRRPSRSAPFSRKGRALRQFFSGSCTSNRLEFAPSVETRSRRRHVPPAARVQREQSHHLPASAGPKLWARCWTPRGPSGRGSSLSQRRGPEARGQPHGRCVSWSRRPGRKTHVARLAASSARETSGPRAARALAGSGRPSSVHTRTRPRGHRQSPRGSSPLVTAVACFGDVVSVPRRSRNAEECLQDRIFAFLKRLYGAAHPTLTSSAEENARFGE